eukprot:scaffold16.g141.t1
MGPTVFFAHDRLALTPQTSGPLRQWQKTTKRHVTHQAPVAAQSAARGAAAASGKRRQSRQEQQEQRKEVPRAATPASRLTPPRKPEVLAPAGGWPQLRAAVEAGADAVYFGLSDFNARARAANFEAEELDEGAEFARRLGVERVVVGRELSVRDISYVSAGTQAEVEAFCHGALCVSYSGQCFSSEAWGGRSANRGQCAQACRMPYGLLVNGQLARLEDVQYLLSPQDLAAIDLVPQMIEAGVSCFKIEGRLKGPEYVALTTQVYRRAVDAAWSALSPRADDAASSSSGDAGGSSGGAGSGGRQQVLSASERRDLAQVFARGQDCGHAGLTPGFLEGSRHQRLVRGRGPRHRGVLLGEVQAVRHDGVSLRLRQTVRRGDGVVFDQGRPQEEEQGGSVFGIAEPGGQQVAEAEPGVTVTLAFGRGQVDARALRPGDLVWKTKDPALEARLCSSYDGLPVSQLRRLPVKVSVTVSEGQPLVIMLSDGAGASSTGATARAAEPAGSQPLTPAAVQAAVGQHLGGEAPLLAAQWDLSGCELGSGGGRGLFVPAGEIKEARRRAVAELLETRRRARRRTAEGLAAEPVVPQLLAEVRQRGEAESGRSGASSSDGSSSSSSDRASSNSRASSSSSAGGAAPAAGAPPRLRVLCRSPGQVEAVLALPWLEEVHGLREASAAVRAAGKRLVVATPRIVKPEEERVWLFYLRLGADALLLRGAGLLQRLLALGGPGARWRGGRERGAGLAGNDYRDCGRPCESTTVHLRDEKGNDHLVLADQACRNTVFNAAAQSALPFLPSLIAAGVGTLRVELVDEPAAYVTPLLEGYRQARLAFFILAVTSAAAGGFRFRTGSELWRFLQELPDANGRAHGVGTGSLETRAERSVASMKPTAASLRQQLEAAAS